MFEFESLWLKYTEYSIFMASVIFLYINKKFETFVFPSIPGIFSNLCFEKSVEPWGGFGGKCLWEAFLREAVNNKKKRNRRSSQKAA